MAFHSSQRVARVASEAHSPVVEQVGPIDQHAEVVELLTGVGVEAHVAVERRLDRRRLERPGRRDRLGPAPERIEQIGEVGAGDAGHVVLGESR